MPKIIELTIELNIDRVSCPGVWLCQDGRVSLTVFALDSSYQTCMLPPIFPLVFKDVFYFRKRFEETCTISNICCLLKEETIYCELVQWCADCDSGGCTVLAQYLGALNDVLFPPNVCSNDGVDLLMRRSKQFPGILAPKIEISTKVRIDEVWDQPNCLPPRPRKIKPCSCPRPDADKSRQTQVCHTPLYHRIHCPKHPRSRSGDSGSCCSLAVKEPVFDLDCAHPANKCAISRSSLYASKHKERCRRYHVYRIETPSLDNSWLAAAGANSGYYTENSDFDDDLRSADKPPSDDTQKPVLESRYIEPVTTREMEKQRKKYAKFTITPCTCQICKRYYELFHKDRHQQQI